MILVKEKDIMEWMEISGKQSPFHISAPYFKGIFMYGTVVYTIILKV